MMNVKKQQMHLQLQQQQQSQRRQNRTGFEALLDQAAPVQVSETAKSPYVSRSAGCAADADRRYHHYHHHHHYDHNRVLQSSAASGDHSPLLSSATTDAASSSTPSDSGIVNDLVSSSGTSPPTDTPSRSTETVTTPPPPSPLSLPSPYYDRNPVIGFPLHHHQHHHAPKSLATTCSSPTTNVPLANVQNVVYAGDQDQLQNDHYTNYSKYYHQRHHHNNYKSNGLSDGRDDDKENIKQQDAECLQQQLDEVLKACVDYEERHKSRTQESATVTATESSGNTSPGTPTTTPPQQNRIKTNGSLPRDSKKTGSSSPTKLSPTSPLSPSSIATFSSTSPLSPSSMTWPTTGSPSSPALSPLSVHATSAGDSDSVFSANDNFPSSPPATLAMPPNRTTCGSPRTRIRTLVPSSSPTSVATCITTTADVHYDSSSKDHQLHLRQYNGDSSDDCGFKISSSNTSLSKLPECVQPLSQASLQSSLQSTSQPSWQTTTSWLRSSQFAADSTMDSGTLATYAVVVSERAAEAAERRRKLLVELSAYKSRLVELHLRREEVDRELIIETALLHAELDAADDETRQSENIVDGLDRAVAECRQQMDACTVKQEEQRTAADSQLVGHRRILQGLRSRLESIEDDDGLKNEIRDAIDKQTELLEAEQKLYEDVEFGLLEEEAGWLARREELHRDRAAAVAVRRARRARAEWLRAQLDQLRSVGDDQLRALRADVNAATLSIQQGHKKLHDLDAAAGVTTSLQDQYRRHHFQYDNSSAAAEHQPPKSLEWSWDHQLRSPMSPSSMSWDQQSKSSASPWSPTTSSGFSSLQLMETAAVNNVNNLMTSSMTTTCCSSIGSCSGGEDDGCRPVSEDSTSRMSMSTIFDGAGSGIKLRPKNLSSPLDITKRPLTRYLPIRYEGDCSTGSRMAFDLRAHIESAGHQLDDNEGAENRRAGAVDRHFWIDSSSCRGYLKKLSGAGGKNSRRTGGKWLKRWFVFDRQSKTLSYYRRRSDDDVSAAVNQGEKKIRPRASIHFQDIQEVYVDHTNSSKGHGCAFVVKTAQRTFYLSATTGQSVRVWVDVIFTGAEGYREYLKTSTTDNGIGIVAASENVSQQTKS